MNGMSGMTARIPPVHIYKFPCMFALMRSLVYEWPEQSDGSYPAHTCKYSYVFALMRGLVYEWPEWSDGSFPYISININVCLC